MLRVKRVERDGRFWVGKSTIEAMSIRMTTAEPHDVHRKRGNIFICLPKGILDREGSLDPFARVCMLPRGSLSGPEYFALRKR
jgi:hypothetical protein